MKIKEIIERIDWSKKKPIEWLDEDFLQQFNYYSGDIDIGALIYDNTNLFEYIPIHNWLCTDTIVGYNLIIFKNNIVALTIQKSRGSQVQYHWLNNEYFYDIQNFLKKYEYIQKLYPNLLDISNDLLIDEYIQRDFSSQIINKTVFYKDVECVVKDTYYSWDYDKKENIKNIKIKYKSKNIIVPVSDVKIKINII